MQHTSLSPKSLDLNPAIPLITPSGSSPAFAIFWRVLAWCHFLRAVCHLIRLLISRIAFFPSIVFESVAPWKRAFMSSLPPPDGPCLKNSRIPSNQPMSWSKRPLSCLCTSWTNL